jgi:SAM-dependent methyltransferase
MAYGTELASIGAGGRSRIRRVLRGWFPWSSERTAGNVAPERIASIQSALASDPLSARLHRDLAAQFATEGSLVGALRAYAELRTAAALGDRSESLQSLLEERRASFGRSVPAVETLGHNPSFRHRALAEAIVRVTGSAACRVLDVGGGDGGLSCFLPAAEYVLAEPTINGIDGERLPFAERSFDVVCACHVLEHVPAPKRALFLDNLARVSRRHVLLLNPFVVRDSMYPERLELILEITGAAWAKEHLECGLPELAEVEAYAHARGFELAVEPNGNLGTSLAFVFLDFMAKAAGRTAELAKINALFNELDVERMTSDRLPVAYLVHLACGAANGAAGTP